MAQSVYEKYAVRKPIYEAGPGVKNRQSPTMTFMSEKQTGAPYYIELGWIYGIPDPNPHIHEHVHDYDEIVLHWGGNYKLPQVLGAEIEFWIGGQPIVFNTTTGIYIPKGTPHGPLIWRKFEFPHIEMAMMLGTGDPFKGWGQSGISKPKSTMPKKEKDFDYEQYVIRSPMREAGAGFKHGRQSPTMTYMSRTQINVANVYIEFGWIWDVVDPPLPKMVHDKYDEIVLHIGGDPENPEDLGADMTFGMGDDLLRFNTSYAMWIPKGVVHGPLIWHAVRKPHIEMAIMLGAGTMAEGWAGSFFGADGRRLEPGQRPPARQ
ncbi:MAG: hypothetical protein N2506_04275 [Dehalococcoidales bacterium]|nr:hypothetical protein [Dehalococcoidales bacterium]